MTELILISDTHCLHKDLHLPAGDILIHAGDFSSRGREHEIVDFLNWFSSQPHQYKILIAGNHDFLAERNPKAFRSLIPKNVIYLEDSGTEIQGIKFWGSPITPWFYDWAFNRRRGAEIKSYWDLIPNDTEVLITHGPPFGFGDLTFHQDQVGCRDLLEAVKAIKPKLHIFGHIHEAYEISKTDNIIFVNASNTNLQYQLVNPAIKISI